MTDKVTPAFHINETRFSDGTLNQEAERGMSLRDYFAAAALSNPYTEDEHSPAKVAEWAYAVADAMMEERTK